MVDLNELVDISREYAMTSMTKSGGQALSKNAAKRSFKPKYNYEIYQNLVLTKS